MALILAIEPDKRQAAQLADLIRGRLNADLVHAQTTEGALTALAGIGDRVPDLVLVPSLLSAQEDAEIAGALRMIAAAANVRMLTIPRFADPGQPSQNRRGVFAKLRGRKTPITPGGCEPAVFADQIAAYLAEAAAERRAAQEAAMDLIASSPAEVVPPGPPPRPAPVVATPPADAPAPEDGATAGEPTLDAPVEPTPIRYAPIIITPRPATAGLEHRPLILDEPLRHDDTSPILSDVAAPPVEPTPVAEPPSIWRTEPASPIVEREKETAFRESVAEPAFAADTTIVDTDVDAGPIEDLGPVAWEAPSTVDEAFPVDAIAREAASAPDRALATPEVEAIDARMADAVPAPPAALEDESQILAIEEVLQALALEEASADAAVQAASPDDAPPDTFIDDAPVVVTIPEEPDVPELLAAPEPEPELAPVTSKRRRKAAKKAAAESDDRFDIDALLAPLLSEIAARRSAPARSEPPRVEPALEVTPPAAAVVSEAVVSPPRALENSEPATMPPLEVVAAVQAIVSDQRPIERETLVPAPVMVDEASPAPSTDVAPAPAVEEAALIEAALVEVAPVAAAPVPAAPVEVAPVETAPVAAAPVEITPVEVASVTAPLAIDDVAPVVAAVLAEEFASVPVAAAPREPVMAIEPPVQAFAAQAMTPAPEPVQAMPIEAVPIEPIAVAPPLDVAPTPATPIGLPEVEVDPMFFADDVHEGRTDPAPHDRPAWVELIESLRQDIERLKAERPHAVAAAPAAPVQEPAPEPEPEPEEKPPAPRIGRVLSIADARNRAEASAKVRTPTPKPRAQAPKPIEDQWGLFDPEQCGFAALRAKLEEISTRDEVSV